MAGITTALRRIRLTANNNTKQIIRTYDRYGGILYHPRNPQVTIKDHTLRSASLVFNGETKCDVKHVLPMTLLHTFGHLVSGKEITPYHASNIAYRALQALGLPAPVILPILKKNKVEEYFIRHGYSIAKNNIDKMSQDLLMSRESIMNTMLMIEYSNKALYSQETIFEDIMQFHEPLENIIVEELINRYNHGQF